MRRYAALRNLLIATMLILAAGPASGQALVDTHRLDTLFAALPYAQTQAEADALTVNIWETWSRPEDPELARLMGTSATLSENGQIERAVDLLDSIIMRWPEYAEAWNRRASINLALGNYEASLADIAETLEREPRHFGAMTGKVEIHLARGQTEAARATLIEALAIHPFLAYQDLFDDLPPLPVWI